MLCSLFHYLRDLPGDVSCWRAASGYGIGNSYWSVSGEEIGRTSGFWTWRMSGNRTCGDGGTLSETGSRMPCVACSEGIGYESEIESANDYKKKNCEGVFTWLSNTTPHKHNHTNTNIAPHKLCYLLLERDRLLPGELYTSPLAGLALLNCRARKGGQDKLALARTG